MATEVDFMSPYNLYKPATSSIKKCNNNILCIASLTLATLDEMGNRIDDLEKNINDLMTQAGTEEIAEK